MDKSDVKIVELSSSQIDQAAHVITQGFGKNDPVFKFILSNKNSSKNRFWLDRDVIRYCHKYGKVYTDENLKGVAAWLPPGEASFRFWKSMRAGFWKVPFVIGWKAWRRASKFDTAEERFHKKVIKRPHWFLYALAVDPKHQGKGIGKALAVSLFEQSDQTGIPCYVETVKEKNVKYYEKLGYKLIASGGEPKKGLPLWGLIREPKPSQK